MQNVKYQSLSHNKFLDNPQLLKTMILLLLL